MYHIDTADAVAAAPARPAATGNLWHWTNGNPGLGVPATIVPDWFMTMIMLECVNVATMHGDALDKTVDTQLRDALVGARGIKAHATDTDLAPAWVMVQNALLVAHGGSRAHATARGLVAASNAGEVSGSNSMVAASWSGGVKALASGTQTALLAAKNAEAGGNQSAVLASEDCDAIGTNTAAIAAKASDLTAAADRSAIVGGQNADLDADDSVICGGDGNVLNNNRGVIAGGTGNTISTAEAFIAASSGVEAAAGATNSSLLSATGSATKAEGTQAVLAGVQSCRARGTVLTPAGPPVLLASKNCEFVNGFAVGGGYAAGAPAWDGLTNKNLQWRLRSDIGDIDANGAITPAAGIDYAEMFPNADFGIIPPGRIVTLVRETTAEGDVWERIRLAKKGDDVLGVVSATPAVIGGGAGLEWAGRHVRDAFGAIVYDAVPMVAWGATIRTTFEEVVVREGFDGLRADAGEIAEGATLYTRRVTTRGSYHGVETADLEVPDDATSWTAQRTIRRAYNGPVAKAPEPIPATAVYYDRAIPKRTQRRTLRTVIGALGDGNRIPMVRWAAVLEPVNMVAWNTIEVDEERVRWPRIVERVKHEEIVVAGYDGPAATAPPQPAAGGRAWIESVPRESPNYDPSRPYTGRRDRPAEWSVVGLFGQLFVSVADDVATGDTVGPDKDGHGRKDPKGRLKVMRVRDGVARCLLLPM